MEASSEPGRFDDDRLLQLCRCGLRSTTSGHERDRLCGKASGLASLREGLRRSGQHNCAEPELMLLMVMDDDGDYVEDDDDEDDGSSDDEGVGGDQQDDTHDGDNEMHAAGRLH